MIRIGSRDNSEHEMKEWKSKEEHKNRKKVSNDAAKCYKEVK